MSARKRRAQVRPGPQEQNQVGSPDLSAIDTASFMEGLRCNHGKPLHSTAMEEELDLPEAGGAAEEMEQGGTRTKTRPAEILQQEDQERKAGSETVFQEELESDAVQHCQRGLLTSDEEGDEEDIWVPKAKKTRVLGLGGPKSPPMEAQRVESQISSFEKVQMVKRENTKVGSLIHTNTQRLLDVKRELRRAERQQWLLQKEETGLQQRLADLKQGQAFLQNIRRLHSLYLEHGADKETYGASSLAALLLETSLAREEGHQP